MMNQDNPYAMNQTCKVCGEPAAGFHFGAFTCEGCKSFFGRSYNNLSSISDCKNNGECIINKKNRTACKACRLRKCLMVGMSKSGSRYGRRSNWFKIHCLLQEQQQQAAAAMAAHHNNQQQAAAAAAAAHAAAAQHAGAPPSALLAGQKPPPPPLPGAVGIGVQPPPPPSSAAASAALGMLGHAGAYPGLYPPRTKEELLMLGLEEYAAAAAAAKHPANASPSVSSPDSHNSDSSIEVSTRNPLLHLGGSTGKHMSGAEPSVGAGVPPQLRKDLPPFLPLPFAGLGGMPVMPPPAFLPPSHLLFPGYHPALYAPHHQSLLKPSPEQQQQAAAAAAAVHQLFNASNAAPSRFPPSLNTANSPLSNAAAAAAAAATSMAHKLSSDKEERAAQSPKNDALNNNHIPNGSKAAEELTKRFYLDAVLKSQQHNSPPPTTTKLPEHTRHHDHSISALVTPNSESGRERLLSRPNNDEGDEEEHNNSRGAMKPAHNEEKTYTATGTTATAALTTVNATTTASTTESHSNGGDSGNGNDCAEEADLVVSMTPPCSPVCNRGSTATQQSIATATPAAASCPARPTHQDNPIDLSMKTGSSVASSLSSKCSSNGSVQATDSDIEPDSAADMQRRSSNDSASVTTAAQELLQIDVDVDVEVDDDMDADNVVVDSALAHKRNGANRSNNNNNNNNNSNSNNNNNNKSNKHNCNASQVRHNSTDSDESIMKLDAVKRKLHSTKTHSETLPLQQPQQQYITVADADAEALQAKRLKLCANETNAFSIEKLSAGVKLNSSSGVDATATVATPTTTPLDLTTKV